MRTRDKRREPGDVLVTVAWGSYALAAWEVPRGDTFAVGEGGALPIPAEVLGAPRVELVRVTRSGRVVLLVPKGAAGSVRLGDRSEALAAFVERWPLLAQAEGQPREVELPLGADVLLELGPSLFTVRVEVGGLERAANVGLSHVSSPMALAMAALSFALHGALVGVFLFARRDLDADDTEEVSRDQILLMRALLEASADREHERAPVAESAPDAADHAGGASAAAKGQEGQAGSSASKKTRGRIAFEGPADNPDPHVARQHALDVATEFGMIGLLGGGAIAALPVNAFEAIVGQGRDPMSVMGSLFDPSVGDRFGLDGLGTLGPGSGGGGDGDFIGIARVGGLDPKLGLGPKGDGLGTFVGGRDGPAGGRPTRGPTLRHAEVETNQASLDKELIKRMVRQQFGRFRFCYEAGLTKNPNLSGRVTVRFVIDRSGAVTMAQDSGSELPDAEVVSCVARAFLALSFPSNPGGIATVVYPIVFSPGE